MITLPELEKKVATLQTPGQMLTMELFEQVIQVAAVSQTLCGSLGLTKFYNKLILVKSHNPGDYKPLITFIKVREDRHDLEADNFRYVNPPAYVLSALLIAKSIIT